MSYFKNPATKRFEADIKDRVLGRLHLALKTRNEREAGRRHAALEAVVRAGRRDLVDRLRAQRLNIEALTECYEAQRPWDTLVAGDAWPTLDVARTEYIAWLDAHPERAESTVGMARGRLARIVEILGPARGADTITLADIEGTAEVPGLRTKLLALGIGDATLAQYLRALGTLYRWLGKREERRALEARRAPRTLHIPLDADLIPRTASRRARFLDPAEAARVMAATPARLQAAVGAALFAGLRIDEVIHLRREDVDLELGILYVQAKPTPWARRKVWKPKSKAGVRELALEPSLARLLAAHVGRFAAPAWLFPGTDRGDRPMSRTALTRATTLLVTRAGLLAVAKDPTGVTFHTLRHTFASWLVMEGIDLFTVSQLLGHASITEVQKTYAHLSPDHRQRAVARLGRRFTLPTLATDDAPAESASDAAPSQPASQRIAE